MLLQVDRAAMIQTGKVYIISPRFKYLRINIFADKEQNDRSINQALVSNVPFMVLDWSPSLNGDFYNIQALIGDQVGYFKVRDHELELITV